jgi:predicted unusual protein kinase regulating ubiquinone biosynthesis (AarF/ABC1/UbiB family)
MSLLHCLYCVYTGMMDGFSPEVRAGLVNLIFSTYENDARACCDALEQMGILKVHVQLLALCVFSSVDLS